MNLARIPNRRFLSAAAIMTIAGVVGLLALRAPSEVSASHRLLEVRPAAETALLVEPVIASAQSVQSENRLSGQVEPYRVATVAAEVSRRIMIRPITQGDRVVKGSLLAALDSAAAQTALDQARAAYAQATAARRQAETDYARAVIETEAARQQARAQVAQAAAGQEQARAQVVQAAAGQQKARTFIRKQELGQAEAALAQTRTDERLAKIEYDRYKELVGEGAAAQQTLDHAQATLEAATARRQSAEQALSLAQEGARREDIEAAAAQVQAANAQVNNTAAQLETARATLRIADTRSLRLATLRQQIDGLRAQEAEAADAVRQARITLDKHRITAPFTGRILATLADVGDMVSPGTPIARLGAIDRVKVTFTVPEASRPALRLGQPMTITVDALQGRSFRGRITALGFQADPRSRAFPIEVTVNNATECLLPNMIARLSLSVGAAARRILIPAAAVATDGATPYVYVLQANRAIRREVMLGTPEGDQVEVLRGLDAGETLAATPQRLTDGATVRLAGRE